MTSVKLMGAAAAALVLAAGSVPAAADAVEDFYKGRIVTITLGTAPGATFGIYAMMLSEHLGKYIPGNPKVIVNARPGGGGMVAAGYVDNAAPRDGTVLSQPVPAIVIQPLFQAVKFDPRNWSWIGAQTTLPGVISVWHTAPATTLDGAKKTELVMGSNGRGTPEHFGVEGDVDLVMGTFSKSFASLGGFVAGSAKVVSFIKHSARSLIFSAAATPASVAAVLASLAIIANEPERRERLWRVTERMRSGFLEMGYDTGASQTPIIPLRIGDDEKGFMLWKLLRDAGIFTTPVIYPAVPEGQAMIRTSYSANHTDEELEIVLDAFRKCGRALGVIG